MLGATNAVVAAPEDGAPEAEAPPDAMALVMAAEVMAAEAAADVVAELEDVLLELEPQALTTSALAATTANSIARVVRVWVDATVLPRGCRGAPSPGAREAIARSWHPATPNMSIG